MSWAQWWDLKTKDWLVQGGVFIGVAIVFVIVLLVLERRK